MFSWVGLEQATSQTFCVPGRAYASGFTHFVCSWEGLEQAASQNCCFPGHGLSKPLQQKPASCFQRPTADTAYLFCRKDSRPLFLLPTFGQDRQKHCSPERPAPVERPAAVEQPAAVVQQTLVWRATLESPYSTSKGFSCVTPTIVCILLVQLGLFWTNSGGRMLDK